MERELVKGNTYRVKTQLVLAREQRKVLEVEKELALRRMGAGTDGGPSKSTDRVGKLFGESGKTVERRIKLLESIEDAAEAGDHKKAEQLTELLNAKQVVKGLELAKGRAAKPAAKPVRKVDVPRTLLDNANKAWSEFYEACAKARVPAEVEQLESYLARMREALETARGRVEGASPEDVS
jgi:hypothetical protein